MKRIAVPFDSSTEAAVTRAATEAGTSAPAWIAGIVRDALMAADFAAIRAFEQANDDPEWETARLEGRA